MELTEIASFDVVHETLAWPWITFDASGQRFAFASSRHRIASRLLGADARIVEGASFELPAELGLPTTPPRDEPVRDTRPGLHGFSLDPRGVQLAVTGVVDLASVLVTLAANGEQKRSSLEALAGPGFIAQAVAFDRGGDRLWVSAESETETAIVLVAARTHDVLGIVKSAPFPPPATHELYLHPHEDALLLLAACGQDGTFARVVRVEAGRPKALWTSLEGGGIPAGMVGFSADATLVHLAEADELRTHAWPGMKELSSVQFDGNFVSSYSGTLVEGRILVDGQDTETKEDAVTMFDATGTRPAFLMAPVPAGMWAGRLGDRTLVTVEAKGEPARGRVMRLAL
jgi:hypothetical protein